MLSAQQISAANPGREIFQLRERKHTFPLQARIVRGAAFFFLFLAAFAFSEIWGYYSGLLIILGFLPDLLIGARHKRAVDSVAA